MPLFTSSSLLARRLRLGLCLYGTLSLAACSLVPAYRQPDLPLADHWDGQSPVAAAAGGQWWHAFHSAELDSLIAQGLAGNYDLKAALSRVDEARSTAQVAGAAQYPLLSLNGVRQRENNYGTTAKGSLYGEATYELDFWGKNRALARSSDALANATVFDARTLHMTLSADIADSYFQVLSLDERLKLARSIANDAQQVLDLVQVQASQGAVSNLEVAQQRNALQTFQAAVPTLQQQRDQALYQLAVLVGVAPQGFRVQGSDLAQLQVPQPTAGLPVGLLRQRPDVQAAEARLESANFDVGAARAAFLPSLSLDLLGGVDTLAGGGIWSAIGTLGQPIFSGGQLTGQLHYDQAHVQELTASYRQSIILGLQDVETQLSATRQLDKNYALSEAAVDSSREASRLAQVRYRLGSTDFQTLLIVERTEYQAEDALLQVRLLHLQAAVGLYRALGGDFSPQAITASSSAKADH